MVPFSGPVSGRTTGGGTLKVTMGEGATGKGTTGKVPLSRKRPVDSGRTPDEGTTGEGTTGEVLLSGKSAAAKVLLLP